GHVAAGTGQRVDEAAADWVGGQRHDDRNPVARLHGRAYRRITEDHQYVDRQERELTRQRRETIQAPFGVAVFHFEVAPLDVAEVAHPEQKLPAQVDRYRVRPPRRIEIAEPHDFRLLRARRGRPCGRRAAEKRDELAAFHSITSSAATSSLSGTVRPSILAVWWLMT